MREFGRWRKIIPTTAQDKFNWILSLTLLLSSKNKSTAYSNLVENEKSLLQIWRCFNACSGIYFEQNFLIRKGLP